jgi:hypothetical protein
VYLKYKVAFYPINIAVLSFIGIMFEISSSLHSTALAAKTFIIYQQLMGGLRKRYANKSLKTFAETLEAFLTRISYNFLGWLQNNMELFAEHKANRGFIWG